MATKKESVAEKPTEKIRTKLEWIESAPHLNAERFEIAGALFDVQDSETLSETDVQNRLTSFRGGEKA